MGNQFLRMLWQHLGHMPNESLPKDMVIMPQWLELFYTWMKITGHTFNFVFINVPDLYMTQGINTKKRPSGFHVSERHKKGLIFEITKYLNVY